MSRCFPFPPPGYEKKTRTDDVDLLIKDKRKERKHKKEKDRKKEGKDKDKERSKDKDREKKDRKEKHKDKKKSKDKRKTGEKQVDGQPESSNGGKHYENNQEAGAIKDTWKIDGKPESSNGGKHCENNQKAEAFKDTRILEINRRITDEERGGRNQMVENPLARNPVEDGVIRFGERYYDSRVQGKETVQDKDGLDRKYGIPKIAEGGVVTANTVVPNFTGAEQKRVGGTPRSTEIVGGVIGTARPMEIVGGVIGNTVVPNFTKVEHKRVGGTSRPMEVEKAAQKKIEGSERSKDPKSNVKQERKHKHKDKDDERKSKEKHVKELEKIKEKVNHENIKQDAMVKPPNDLINTLDVKPIKIPSYNGPSCSMEENLRKRKDCETNGLLHDNVLPILTPRPTFPSVSIGMNGRKPEQGQASPQLASAMHRGLGSIRFDTKALKANGLIQPQRPSASSAIPIQAKENGKESKKPPHPDSKYLSAILTVPKMDDMPDFDDQEWLFGSDSLPSKKPKMVSSEIDESTQVWDRALRIDSADVCALPYVIPY